jgi:hypothetical protein
MPDTLLLTSAALSGRVPSALNAPRPLSQFRSPLLSIQVVST